MPGVSYLPTLYHRPQEMIRFPSEDASVRRMTWPGVDADSALSALLASQNVQEATSLDREGLLRRFLNKWTPDSALNSCQFF